MEENKKISTVGNISSIHYNSTHKNHLNWKRNQIMKAILLPH